MNPGHRLSPCCERQSLVDASAPGFSHRVKCPCQPPRADPGPFGSVYRHGRDLGHDQDRLWRRQDGRHRVRLTRMNQRRSLLGRHRRVMGRWDPRSAPQQRRRARSQRRIVEQRDLAIGVSHLARPPNIDPTACFRRGRWAMFSRGVRWRGDGAGRWDDRRTRTSQKPSARTWSPSSLQNLSTTFEPCVGPRPSKKRRGRRKDSKDDCQKSFWRLLLGALQFERAENCVAAAGSIAGWRKSPVQLTMRRDKFWFPSVAGAGFSASHRVIHLYGVSNGYLQAVRRVDQSNSAL
jgi:hypothetical protein